MKGTTNTATFHQQHTHALHALPHSTLIINHSTLNNHACSYRFIGALIYQDKTTRYPIAVIFIGQ